ncbi:hypothetical protein [Dyadobacter sandarakinus]|uniref:Phage protein, HK97 gp10 family n=1 Tax=Dyadobacter sandarakinus TaxID=2747268 RepID=A0ABX7I1I6_9BACT|nr:hypothetical protein [Dyadobacter sandarakinus]QRQ99714.1 hypothetical protein HWI92_01680 [Dyadobacter sandarakinus]
MRVKIDTKELDKLAKGLSRYESVVPRSVKNTALRRSSKPMLDAAKKEAPVGRAISGRNNEEGGGATRSDLRIKAVKPEPGEDSRVLVGVSKRRGKVGWRTHFITRGFTDRGGKRHAPNDFLKRAYESTIEAVGALYKEEILIAFKKWADKNLPRNY